ncbi:Sec63 [Cadophora gregata]|uniref:Sec63 n=1 Tax=Cadophora gregata TaxID=51156 RepID=UPI0026DB5682|nr:Sec63 [Cadophora gregata]KAK0124320.1 Sec63 [Cadophora gregata]
MVHGIQLISPHVLPDRFRQIFPYQLFNAAQSKCFDPIYKTNDNVVVSAPTGSGKTALLELAICKAVESFGTGQFKIVYQAPTKSLCSERVRDWDTKFSHLNLPCAELTGDTSQSEMARVRSASIIVTTPEKWDSITRKWSDHQKLVQMVKLFLIDEVHILKDARGATLEAVVSRMKTMGANVRFIALSATVPNSEDIAVWLGRDHTNEHIPAHRETFGEEFRPIRLQKHVHGYDGNPNDFAFEKVLDGKLPALLRQYSQKKPIMIFCFTRKSCETTAQNLAEWWFRQSPADRVWPAPLKTVAVSNKDLHHLVSCGVSYHHAGLDLQDRMAIESGFLKGDVNVICCTSTLAVGVNLPCHTVVLKGTVCFQDSHLVEYSDLEVMQMLGRAGRPQYENSAVAVIMTRSDKVNRYKKMVSGQDILESTLHLNLIEHLNSEISLGTIKNVYDAKRWLSGTFLSVRMRQNPNYYKIEGASPGGDADRRLEQVCERDILLLQQHKLASDQERIGSTEYGVAMSRFMVQFETMKLLLSIPSRAGTEQILHVICQAAEFRDLRMKPNERQYLREFNKSPFLKFPIKENVTTTHHKVSLLIQVQLGGIEDPTDKEFFQVRRQFATDRSIVFDRIQRLIHCVIECKAYERDSVSTRHALDLARSISAGFWEYSNLQLRQLPQFGPVATRKLVSNSVSTVEQLGKMDTASIERLVSKNPPFGKKTRDVISGFPILNLTCEIVKRITEKPKASPKIQVKARLWYENDKIPIWKGRKPSVTFLAETTDGKIVHFWRGNISRLEKDFDIRFTVELLAPDVDVKCWVACEDIVGTVKSCILKHNVPASEFPPVPVVIKTKIKTAPNTSEDSVPEVDEFGTGEVDDDDMIAAINGVETGKTDYGSDEFLDIDDAALNKSKYQKPTTGKLGKEVKEKGKREVEVLEPFQMANGKWTCNHACRDGQLLKNGQPCKHYCCREGLDKPRKTKKKQQSSEFSVTRGMNFDKKNLGSRHEIPVPRSIRKPQPKLKLGHYSDTDDNNAEMVDLSNVLSPVSYSDLAPRDYRKLHKLHTSVQSDKASIRLNQKPHFSYASHKEPEIPFLKKKSGGLDDEQDFPSPSALVGDNDPFDLDLDQVEICKDNTRETLPLESISPYRDASIESLEADMVAFDHPVTAVHTTPNAGSSFCNELFDFEAFENIGDEPVPISASGAIGGTSNITIPTSGSTPPKRTLSLSPEKTEVKHRRIMKDLSAAPNAYSFPSWVNEFDSELIAGLENLVEFVD